MDGSSADALVARLRAGRPLLLLHVNADPDAVGAAFALHEAFGGVVGAPEGLSRPGARLAARLGLSVDEWPHPEQFDPVVVVDTSSRSQLGRLGPRVRGACLVDHHRYGDLRDEAPAMAWDPARGSCCEVVLALLDRAGHAPSPQAAFALLVGLVADTARFRHVDAAGLRDAARLVEGAGASVEEALDVLEGDEETPAEDDPSQRRATLLAASRAKVDSVGPWLVATSEVGSFDALAATTLVRAGADLAVVACEKSGGARMSLRASRRLRAAGLDLGLLANETAREVGWSGGGHEGAAGLTGSTPLEAARAALLARVRAKLEAS